MRKREAEQKKTLKPKALLAFIRLSVYVCAIFFSLRSLLYILPFFIYIFVAMNVCCFFFLSYISPFRNSSAIIASLLCLALLKWTHNGLENDFQWKKKVSIRQFFFFFFSLFCRYLLSFLCISQETTHVQAIVTANSCWWKNCALHRCSSIFLIKTEICPIFSA